MNNYKDFQDSIKDGEEYVNCSMSISTFNGIDFELQELMYQSDIRQKNTKFKDDEVHKALAKNVSKAKKALRNYEYNCNHNNKNHK